MTLQYVGSKKKIAEPLSRILEALREHPDGLLPFYSLFCGSCAVESRMRDPRVLSDSNEDLILLLKAFLDGDVEQFPTEMDEGTYREWKRKKPSAMRAWVGFQWCYRSRFFNSFNYMRTPKQVASARDRLLEDVKPLRGAELLARSYADALEISGAVVYCDPPYIGTATYPDQPSFDHVEFWQHMDRLAANNIVVVSEYAAPKHWPEVHRWWTTVSLKHRVRAEKIFVAEKYATFVRSKIDEVLACDGVSTT